MYEIRPESIKTFITDRNVKLPRFQRKQTWDDKKNFQLCISLFKEYPIGVCILSVDETRGKTVRWLLDGRQRKNALQSMYDDPENIYNWAKRFIGFKHSDQPIDIDEKFRAKIKEYIEADSDEDVFTPVFAEDTSEPRSGDDEESFNPDAYGLQFLLDIIKIIHNKQKKNTGFTKPFDFTQYVKRLPYVESGEILISRKVKTFIDEYRKYCDDEDVDYEKVNSFLGFIKSRYEVTDDEKLTSLIKEKWVAIKERILIVEKIDNLLSNSKIGMIEVKNLSPSDSQKIFNIINSEGEKLTSVEILSAKPHWNIKIEYPSAAAKIAIEELYKKIGTVQDDVVRWDLPATLVKRLGDNFIIKKLSDSKTDFEKELTLGFKILAAIYTGGVKKENIEELGRKKTINWETDVEQLIKDLQDMIKLIGSYDYFKYFRSWKTSMMELTSDAIAIDFIAIAYLDWARKGKPIGDNHAKQFQKNCFILWDKLIFEYLNKQWRGAADLKTANNIAALTDEPEVFIPITTEKWKWMLEGQIFAESAIESVDISLGLMKPVLYHMYCLKHISGPDTAYAIEVDHIIPKTLFEQSTIARSAVIKDNLLNLGLLPKDENVAKSNKKLVEINSQWLKDQILRYEFIDESNYVRFSNVSNYLEMFEERKLCIMEAFIEKRTDALNN